MTVFEQLLLFRLPSAEPRQKMRHLLIGGRVVSYQLRPARRRLSMTIDERGLRVGAPRHVPMAEIDAFIRAHGDWALRKLDEFAARGSQRHLAVRDGCWIPVLGENIQVRVTTGANRIRWEEATLVLASRADGDLDQLARRALQRRALEHFAVRLAHYAERLDRPLPRLSLSSARTRWGSCSEKTGIRLNWRLIHLEPRLVDYVVAHEMAHLVEMNHGPRFWAVVASLYPDWRLARADLRRQASTMPLL